VSERGRRRGHSPKYLVAIQFDDPIGPRRSTAFGQYSRRTGPAFASRVATEADTLKAELADGT
jgi:hypothetical protein